MNKFHSVSIVILNYNRPLDTLECIKSLQQIDYPSFHILLIDNCSTDNSLEEFKKKLSGVEIYNTQENLGYTGGVNFGLKIAEKFKSEYILLLNNDTIVEKDFLTILVSAVDSDISAAAACGTILCEHKRNEIWYAGGKMIRWRGLAIHNGKKKLLDRRSDKKPVYTSFITGCSILLRAKYLEEIGYEDDRFFMYLDDIELSSRIQDKGYKLLYVPNSIIYHKVLNESESAFKLYYSVRNRMLLISLISNGFNKIIASTYFLIVISFKLIIWKVSKPSFFKAAIFGLEDYFKKIFFKGRGFEQI